MGNKQRIIDAAVELMNKNGSTVGTTQLTEHLSISPGNLYYHFRNREEILAEVLLRLHTDLDEAMELAPGEELQGHGGLRSRSAPDTGRDFRSSWCSPPPEGPASGKQIDLPDP